VPLPRCSVVIDVRHLQRAEVPMTAPTAQLAREAHLRVFLQRCRDAFDAASHRLPAAREVATRIFTALELPAHRDGAPPAARVPACDHLAAALAAARTGPGAVPALADALDAIAPRLAWYRRPGSQPTMGRFHDGHASAVVVGAGGLEARDDVRVGLSLMAPQVRYPDHQHPPEEIYIALTPGQWRQRDGPWHEPGAGGIVHNPPGIVHAMRSGVSPLLAVWCLWMAA
jgi:quercetin dioxygenase-like cupin family protein